MKIAIIGAGISGLTTAFYLDRAMPGLELAIFDAAPEPGGTMHTENVDGFLFEAGGNGFLTNKPDSLKLVHDAGADDLLYASSDLARKRFIFTDQLHRLPESPPLFLKSGLLTFGQKLRVLGEPFIRRSRNGGDETLQEFGYRRLGKGFTDVMLDAMVAGIYATTPDRLSVAAAFPLIVNLEREYGGLFRGMLAKRKKGAGPGGILMSFKGGVGSFIDHLSANIDAEWHLGEGVSAIEKTNGAYRVIQGGFAGEFDKIVVAAPAYAAADMLEKMDIELATRLRALDYSPIAVVGFGYRDLRHELDGFGLLTTTSAQKPILGVLWDSSVFPDRAPQGCKALRIMIGGQRNPELVSLEESALIETARQGLQETMSITQAPDVVYVRRWRRGIPSYAPGHIDRVDRIFAQVAAHDGLYLTSNAYRGIAMNDAVLQARHTSERIVAEIGH